MKRRMWDWVALCVPGWDGWRGEGEGGNFAWVTISFANQLSFILPFIHGIKKKRWVEGLRISIWSSSSGIMGQLEAIKSIMITTLCCGRKLAVLFWTQKMHGCLIILFGIISAFCVEICGYLCLLLPLDESVGSTFSCKVIFLLLSMVIPYWPYDLLILNCFRIWI